MSENERPKETASYEAAAREGSDATDAQREQAREWLDRLQSQEREMGG